MGAGASSLLSHDELHEQIHTKLQATSKLDSFTHGDQRMLGPAEAKLEVAQFVFSSGLLTQ